MLYFSYCYIVSPQLFLGFFILKVKSICFNLSSPMQIWINDCSFSLCSIRLHTWEHYYISLSLLFKLSNPSAFSFSSHDMIYRSVTVPSALPVHLLLNHSAHDLLHLQATVLFLKLSMVMCFSLQKGHCWVKSSSCSALILRSLHYSDCGVIN